MASGRAPSGGRAPPVRNPGFMLESLPLPGWAEFIRGGGVVCSAIRGKPCEEDPSRYDRVVYSNAAQLVWLPLYYLVAPGEGSPWNWIDFATGFPSLIS